MGGRWGLPLGSVQPGAVRDVVRSNQGIGLDRFLVLAVMVVVLLGVGGGALLFTNC